MAISVKPGNNDIKRLSDESEVTIPSKNYFEPDIVRQDIALDVDESSYCLSGWPSHLLVPMGMSTGANFLLFAMITDDKMVT